MLLSPTFSSFFFFYGGGGGELVAIVWMQQRSSIAFVTTCIYVMTIFKKFSMATFKRCLKIYAVLKHTTNKYVVLN